MRWIDWKLKSQILAYLVGRLPNSLLNIKLIKLQLSKRFKDLKRSLNPCKLRSRPCRQTSQTLVNKFNQPCRILIRLMIRSRTLMRLKVNFLNSYRVLKMRLRLLDSRSLACSKVMTSLCKFTISWRRVSTRLTKEKRRPSGRSRRCKSCSKRYRSGWSC